MRSSVSTFRWTNSARRSVGKTIRHSVRLKTSPHILVVSAFRTPFIDDDVATLRRHFPTEHLVGSGPGQFVRIASAVRSSSLVISWFASVYGAWATLLARSRRTPAVMIVGGVDLAKEPDLAYGLWLSRWRGAVVGKALRSATRVLAVDESLVAEARMRAGYDGKNIECLPTGYDAEAWTPHGRKTRTVLTVAVAHDVNRARVKGIDTLVETARQLDAIWFEVVGVDPAIAAEFHPPVNMRFTPKVDRSALLSWYRRCKVYCQPSRREGLPNALCEAMLCGCVPVVTDVGGQAHATGTAGFVVPARNSEALADALARAMRAPMTLGKRARRRIATEFPRSKREASLVRLVGELTA